MSCNLFVTGEKRTGKSSLLKKIVEPYRKHLGGFFTQRIYSPDGDCCAFRLVDLSSEESYRLETKLGHSDVAGRGVFFRRFSSGVFHKNIVVFDTMGAGILTGAVGENKGLILIDEIGRMEDDAAVYRGALETALDSGIPVLGALQKVHGSLIRRVMNRKDTSVLELSDSNGHEIMEEVTGFIKRNCPFAFDNSLGHGEKAVRGI